MVEAPERIWSKLSSAYGMVTTYAIKPPDEYLVGHTEYLRADIAERQIAELRAELDRAIDERDEARQEPWPKWADEIRKCLEGYGVDPGDEWDLPEQFEMWIAGVVENETARAKTAEADNARLRALPLKDEVERELADIEENLDDAVRYLVDLAGAKPSPMSPHNCRIYIDHARMGARNLAFLISRLRAGEQEGWRSMDSAPKDGTVIEAIYNNDFTSEPDRVFWQAEGRCCVLGSRAGAYPPGWTSVIAGSLPVDPPSHWRPAVPSEHGGERG